MYEFMSLFPVFSPLNYSSLPVSLSLILLYVVVACQMCLNNKEEIELILLHDTAEAYCEAIELDAVWPLFARSRR